IRITDSLQAALNNKGNLIKLEYVITKVQETKTAIGWLNRFPFDYKTVVVPIKMQQPAIVSKIEFPRQSDDFIASISAKGLFDVTFNEGQNGYQLDMGRPDSRITI